MTLATVAAAVQFEGFRITMIWALEAAALAWLAAKYGEPRLRWAVLALTALVAARLVALDGPAYLERPDLALLSNTRFLTCAVAALSLGAAAWWVEAEVGGASSLPGGARIAPDRAVVGELHLGVAQFAARRAG